jgi:uncharacterized protein (TIGR02145 family)
VKIKCGDDYYNPAEQFCSEQDNRIYPKCGGKSYDIENQTCENAVVYDICGSSKMNSAMEGCCNNAIFALATQFCFYADDNIYDKCGAIEYNPLEQICENGIAFLKCDDKWYDPSLAYCASNIVKDKETFVDDRDGKAYKYVTIGEQTWMAENLRYETSNTKCYDDNPDNCEIFGILYNWNAANAACPLGWHLPNDAEWNALINFANAGGGSVAARLKANSELWVSGKGTDNFGFTALPGGYYRFTGYFWEIGEIAAFWSATAGSAAGSAHLRFLKYDNRADLDGLYTNNSWVNVRCIRN